MSRSNLTLGSAGRVVVRETKKDVAGGGIESRVGVARSRCLGKYVLGPCMEKDSILCCCSYPAGTTGAIKPRTYKYLSWRANALQAVDSRACFFLRSLMLW